MNHKILIAASVGLSLFAAAQSQTDKQKPQPSTTQTQTTRDTASGQASGKLEEKKVIHRDLAARDVATGQASRTKSAHDDWSQPTAVSTSAPANVKPVAASSGAKPSPRVAAGDVNGDGVADAAASKNSAHASESLATAPSPKAQTSRDVATGQMSGKRQHQPLVIEQPKSK